MVEYVKRWDNRFGIQMYSDSRLSNKQANFCLCTCCLREDVTKGVECPTHKGFMRMTRVLTISAPVFACLGFIEDKSKPNKLNIMEFLDD